MAGTTAGIVGLEPAAVEGWILRLGLGAQALRSRPFHLYFAGQVASASGTFLQQTAIGWLVLQLAHSAAALGLVLAAARNPPLQEREQHKAAGLAATVAAALRARHRRAGGHSGGAVRRHGVRDRLRTVDP